MTSANEELALKQFFANNHVSPFLSHDRIYFQALCLLSTSLSPSSHNGLQKLNNLLQHLETEEHKKINEQLRRMKRIKRIVLAVALICLLVCALLILLK